MRESVQNYYNNYWKYRSEGYSHDPARVKRVLGLVGTGLKVFDIGAGTGELSLKVQEKGNEVEVSDVSEEVCKLLEKKGLKTVVCSGEEIPVDSASFDLVLANEVVEHVFDVHAMFDEVNRILKPKGEFIFSTPNHLYYRNRLVLLKGDLLLDEDEAEDKYFNEQHIHSFNYGSLVRLIEDHGFKVVKEAHLGLRWFPKLREIRPSLFARKFIFKVQKLN